MATRILSTIKENGKLIGFKVATNNKQCKGVHVLTLQGAEQFYRTVEKFDNAELQGHRWVGTECSLDKLPEQDRFGRYIKKEAEVIILNKLERDGKTKGFTVMNLDGIVSSYSVKNTLSIAEKFGLINAELVKTSDTKYIRGKRKEIPVRIIKTTPSIRQEKQKKSRHSINGTLQAVDRDTQSSGVITNILGGNNSNMDEKLKRMKELVSLLAKAAEVYYTTGNEIMSNYEYDKLYDELEKLEKETGIILANSVTQKVGYQVQSKLAKVKHPTKVLSLDKTKDVNDLANSLGGQSGFLGWKLDGLTVVTTYENGKLLSAVTRGNGTVGEDITENFKTFANVPLTLSSKERLVLRGEALISYKTFEEINSKITSEEAKYKNPRNLCSGSVRQLDPKITKERKVHFVVFTVVDGFDECQNYTEKLERAKGLGFEVVDYVKVTKDIVADTVAKFEKAIVTNPYPTDGLVITIDNIAYGEMLGTTNKFPRNAKAFKWKDEAVETRMVGIDWSVSRTGVITPVAVFEPIDIEGSTVARASLHNISILKETLGENPYKGQKVWVIKSNMIIPQIVDSEKE